MAVAVDLKKVFGREGSVVDLLAESKGNDGILSAVDDQNGGVDFLYPRLSIELPVCKKADAREKPENFAGNSRSGRKRSLKNYACNLAAGCQVVGDGRAEGLAERNDRFAVDTFCVHEVFVGCFGIAVDASFVRFSFAVAITPVFQG